VEQHVEWHDAMNKVLATSFFVYVEARKRIFEWPRAMATLVSTLTDLLRHFWSTDVRKCMELWNDGGFEVGKFSKYLHSVLDFLACFTQFHPIPRFYLAH